MTQASNKDHIGNDVAMERDNADEDRAEHPSPGPDSRRRITTKREPRGARDDQSGTAEQHVPRRISGKTTPQEQAVTVTTQEALDGNREKTVRIANVENHTLNWVSVSSAGALDKTHCDSSVKSARDEMRRIIGSSEPDVIIGSDKDQNRRCKKRDKDHTEFLWELYEAQAACGRYFVHELTSEANSRMRCVAKIMATLGRRTAVADLCMFGLAACDEGGPGFVNLIVRTITIARQVGMRLLSKCTGTHRRARINANNTIESGEQTETWVRQVTRAKEEQLKEDQQEFGMREQKREAEDAKRIRGIVHEHNENKRLSYVQNERGNSCIKRSRSCSACGKDGTGMTTKADGLIQSCAPGKARGSGVHPSPQDVHKSHQRSVPTQDRKGTPSRQDRQRLTRD